MWKISQMFWIVSMLLATNVVFATPANKDLLFQKEVRFHNRSGAHKGSLNGIKYKSTIEKVSETESLVTIVIDISKKLASKRIFMAYNLQHAKAIFKKNRVIIKNGRILHTEPEVVMFFKALKSREGSQGVIYITTNREASLVN